MRFKDLINERLLTVLDIQTDKKNVKKVQVFKNSNLSEFVGLLDQWKQMRGMCDDRDFYIFNAHHMHHYQVANELGFDINDFFIWETADDFDDEIRNIQVTNSVTTKFKNLDEYTLFQFCLNHPTFGKIVRSGRFSFFNSHLMPDE